MTYLCFRITTSFPTFPLKIINKGKVFVKHFETLKLLCSDFIRYFTKNREFIGSLFFVYINNTHPDGSPMS